VRRMGEGRVVRPRAPVVKGAQAALLRLLLMSAAWALGRVLVFGIPNDAVSFVVPGGLATGVYLLTEDLGRGGFGGGPRKYWRGRPVDDDERKPWN
jgi:hypothetical protein